MDRAVAPHVPPAATNFRDGLGERRRTSDTTGDTIELLCLRRELTAVPSFEFALRERASRLASFRHDAFTRVRSIDRLGEPSAALAVVSDFTRGVRLSQLLTPNGKRPVKIDINAALHLIRQLVSAVAALHDSARDVAHGAIGLERIIVTANARVALVEYVLGAALEQLRYSPERYWKDLRIALPPTSSPAMAVKFDHRADVTQLGMVALSLVLGRSLTDDEHPAAAGDLLASAQAISSGSGHEPLPQGLRDWIGRALQLDTRHAFASAPEARAALDNALSAPTGAEASARPSTRATKAAAVIAELNEPARPGPATAASRTAIAPVPSQAVAIVQPQPVVLAEQPLAVASAPEPKTTIPIPECIPAAGQPLQKPAPTVLDPESAARREPRPIGAMPVVSNADAVILRPVFDPAGLRSGMRSLPSFEPIEGAFEQFGEHADEEEGARKKPWRRVAIAAGIVALLAAAGTYGGRQFFSAPTPGQSTGTLNVASNPAGAQVFVDRQSRGMTPLTLTLRPGLHSLELRGIGEPRTVDVTITAGTQASQYIELSKKAAPATFGQLQVRTDPPGARLTVDGVARGKAPMLVEGLTPGDHSVILEGDLGTVRQTVTVGAATTASLVVPMTGSVSAPMSGWLTLTAPVEMEIRERGKVLGTSQTDRIMVTAGRHELEIVSDTLGYRATVIVQVPPGKVAPITIEWPKGTASLNAEPWAEVWIGGEKIGETPIGNLSLPIGPHEIVFRHPELGEQRHAVSVSLKNPARLSVDMRKP